jgi:hypothetical protein
MRRLSIEEYWERLERHDRFYAWAESADEYDDLVREAKALFHLSRLSDAHSQLYTTYWTATYLHVSLDGDEVQDIERPMDGLPEAA